MEILRVALGEIQANKTRALLTMLGIVIGVAAVITMVALGTGAQAAVESQLEALGTDLLSVHPGQSRGPGGRGVASAERVSLTIADADALAASGRFAAVIPELAGNQQIEFGGQNANVNILATTADHVLVNNYAVDAGRAFTKADDDARRRVALLGSAVPGLFGSNGAAMIGQQLAIRGVRFEIVGILSEKGAQGFSNPDEQVVIPLATGRYRVFGSDQLRAVTMQVADADSMELAMLDIEGVLRQEHGIRPGDANDFTILDRSEFLSAQQETTATFTFLLAAIAAVSLLVGGIGIMNIMLVSVTERTKEIGVRKALGATRRSIMMQFLIEAITICSIGGVVGVMLGSGGSAALSQWQGWATRVSPEAVLVALGFSAAVGIFFGLWPARRAARLDPIEALRHE